MARVGVCTRPAVVLLKPPPWELKEVRARVELMPTSQSDSERESAASASGCMSASERRFWKAARMDSAVIDWSQRRLSGFFTPVARMMFRKISSPSRPASQALMMASTSFRLRRRLRTLSRPTFLSMGASANSGGSDGRFSIFHFPRAGSKPSGGASSSRWPTADEMTHWSFSYQSPSFFTPSTRARSVATLGFSAMTRVLDMGGWVTKVGRIVGRGAV